MLLQWTMILAALPIAGDTLVVSVEDALDRAMRSSPMVAASDWTIRTAEARRRQAEAWRNPTFSISAENVGGAERFTGTPGFRGVEGQALIGLHLPLGGDRAAKATGADADQDAAVASAAVARARLAVTVLTAIARADRDGAFVQSAREELETLDRLTAALRLQAETGRASRGDAARADLARGMAATRLARRETTHTRSVVELGRLLGYEAVERVRVTIGRCAPGDGPVRDAGGEGGPPELLVRDASVRAAAAATDAVRAGRIPDLEPQIGVRRTGGETGFYLGFSTQLPLFDRAGASLGAATSAEEAEARLRDDESARWVAARAVAAGSLEAMERAGEQFGGDWFASLDVAVAAPETRYRLGEGSLYELLDSRRARLQALDDYHAWIADWWEARIALARAEGRRLTAGLLCRPERGGSDDH